MSEEKEIINQFYFQGHNTALLLVDFQNEFVNEGGKLHGKVYSLMNETQMLVKVQEVLQKMRNMNAKVIHSGVSICNDESESNLSGKISSNNGCWDSIRNFEGLFTESFWNTEFAEELKPLPTETTTYRKHIDAFKDTDLEENLMEDNIDTLFVCGFLTDMCVSETVRTAAKKGFNVLTLSDGCAAKSGGAHYAALKCLSNYSTVISCEKAIKLLDSNVTKQEKKEMCNQAISKFSYPEKNISTRILKGKMKDQRPSILDPDTPVFFMIGSDRSGHRWLVKKGLATRNDVWIPESPHILRNIMPTLDNFGDLNNDVNLKALVEAVCTFIENKKKGSWLDQNGNKIIFDRERITEIAKNSVQILRVVHGCKKITDKRIFLISIFDEIMNTGAIRNGKRTWMNLAREDVQYHSLLMTYYGKDRLRYIYTVRDPRDELMSYKETPTTTGNKEPYALGKKWAEEQQTALGIISRNKKIVHTIKCEDLVLDQDRVLKGMKSFLDGKSLDKSSGDTRSKAQSRNDETDRGSIISSWRQALSEGEIHVIESVCARQMTRLGYKLEINKPSLTKFSKGVFNLSSSFGSYKRENSFAEDLLKL